jgi:hypothetical protein
VYEIKKFVMSRAYISEVCSGFENNNAEGVMNRGLVLNSTAWNDCGCTELKSSAYVDIFKIAVLRPVPIQNRVNIC